MNMQEINVNSWEEFEEQLQGLEKERFQQKSLFKFLYRGQGDHSLKLLTTLERNEKERLSLNEYYGSIFMVKPQIESFTGHNWNIPLPQKFNQWLKENDTFMPHAMGSLEFQDIYSYMVYLRHYGFPSPLLDWSTSPYVAAYFAFRQAPLSKKNVSIYVFVESLSEIGLTSGTLDQPEIHRLGPYVRTDRRHFLQQSQYTICIIRDSTLDGEWRYAPHEEAFLQCDPNQDLLWKFNIVYSERLKVLRLLDRYNLNALTLFGSEESLVETMGLRGIHFRERDL